MAKQDVDYIGHFPVYGPKEPEPDNSWVLGLLVLIVIVALALRAHAG